MSKPNQRVAKTDVDITLDSLVPVDGKSENKNSYIFYCPYCIEKVGKKDITGKLYLYKSTLTGVCFRCNTHITIKADIDSDFDFSGLTFKRLQQQIIQDTDILPYDEAINISKLQPWYSNTQIFDYLLNERGYHIFQAADRCQFKVFNSKDRIGVFIPYFMNDTIVSYQIRYLAGKGRYWTRPGKRFLYTPGGLQLKPINEITICEGVFDSIALEYLGYPIPIAVCGSALSTLQLNTIKELAPEIVNIALDDYNLSNEMLKVLKKELALVERFQIINFNKKDPDDYVKEQIKNEVYRKKARDFAASCAL